MVLDYSKFDNIELSDDSDIEVHPNIDKKSFIKWKQRDIHEKRELARQQTEEYRKEIRMNTTLRERIETMMQALKTRSGDPASDVIAQTMAAYPPQQAGDERNGPSYTEMMESLLKQIAVEVQTIREEDKSGSIIHKLSMHRDKLLGLITKRHGDIAKLEQEQSKKITSDGLRDAWNYSSVTKAEPEMPYKQSILKTNPHDVDDHPKVKSKSKSSSTKRTGTVQAIETIHPGADPSDLTQEAKAKRDEAGYHTDPDAELEDDEVGDDDGEAETGVTEHIEPSKIGREFGAIRSSDYDASLQFLGKHPNLLRDETETDGLLIDAYYAEMRGDSTQARNSIHQGLLLQYCRQLGRDGVSLFFKRLRDPEHRAHRLFVDDVAGTYDRIKQRAIENRDEDERLAAAGSDGGAGSGQVEQIQLHAVEPGTKIGINVPPADSSDPEVQECRKLFESLSPGMQRAVESGSLDRINAVLGKMAVEEAEECVERLSAGGMLAIEQEILDATKPDFVMPDKYKPGMAGDRDTEGSVEPVTEQKQIAQPAVLSAVDDVD